MEPIYILLIFLLLSFLLSQKGEKSYKNVYAAIASVVGCSLSIISGIVFEALGFSGSQWIIALTAIPCAITLISQAVVKKLSKSDGYFPPYRYTNGKLAGIISVFYERKQNLFYLKTKYRFVKNLLFAIALLEVCILIPIIINASAPINLLICMLCPIVATSFEVGLFLCGTTQISVAEDNYKSISKCSTPEECMSAKYEYPDDYEYMFRLVNKTEKPHLLHSTIHNYKENGDRVESIRLYDFEKKQYTEFVDYEQNDRLNEFLLSNNIQPNNLYVQIFTLLSKGNNVLMESSSYADFDPYLAALMKKISAETYKTIVVVGTDDSGNSFIQRYNRIFKEYFGIPAIPVIRKFKDVMKLEYEEAKSKKPKSGIDSIFGDVFTEDAEYVAGIDKLKADVIVVTPEDILDSGNAQALRKFASEIDFIIYYDFSECVHEETLFSKIVHSVLDADDRISTLYMTDGFFDFKQAINNFFSARPFYEVVVPRDVPQKSYCTVWKYENAEELQERAIINPSVDFGMHPVLAVFASNYLNNNCMVIADENDIYAETFSEFSSTSAVSEKIDCFVGWKDIIDGKYVYCSVTDRYNNIPHTYLAIRGVGKNCEYVNIVSKPYLLREYLAYFSKFFSTVPDALTSFSAATINTPRAIALEGVMKSYLMGCTEKQIRDYAAKIRLDYTLEPMVLIDALIKETKLLDDDTQLNVTFENERYYINKEVYDSIIDKTEFVEKIYFSVNNQEIVRYKKDFNYLVPRQKLVLDGKKYTVISINGSRVELSDSQAREPVYSTRLVRACRATAPRQISSVHYASNNNSASMEMTNLICDLDIDIYGRISFKDDYSFDETRRMNNYMYTKASSKFSRSHKDANILKVKLNLPSDITAENKRGMAHTLALLINEMLPTFFPAHSERIVVACSEWNEEVPDDGERVNLDYIVAPFEIENDESCNDDEFCIYMFEDSVIETGVVNVFWQDEELKYMFKILDDYLYYIEVVDRDTRNHIFGNNTDKPLHELRKALLHLIDHPMENGLTEYANGIRRTRDTFSEKRLSNTYSMVCDYCGKPIRQSGTGNDYKYYHYSGKQSCLKCASTAVTTETGNLLDVCNEKVLAWIADSYKTSIEGPSLNLLEDAEFINKIINPNEYYAVTDDRDYGVVGYTRLCDTPASVVLQHDEELMYRISEGISGDRRQLPSSDCEDWIRAGYFVENANIILIENGLPQFLYESVEAHELSHQWQYEQLDMTKVYLEPYPFVVRDEFGYPVDLSTFRLEGQASWVECMYLQKHGHSKEAAENRRALRNRSDVYGVGYRWFSALMRIGGTDKYSSIPRSFRFKIKRLWYQITKNPYALMKLYYGKATSEKISKDNSDPDTDSANVVDTDENT